MNAIERLPGYLRETGLDLTETQLAQFDRYARFLTEYNEHVNLTAITDPEAIMIRHFADSLQLCRYVTFSPGTRVCDVGSGAGFPGVCLLIANPEISLTLMDSVGKKTAFLRALLSELGLSANVIQIRAEEAGQDRTLRETFQVVTARAVASLNVLAEYCVPLTTVGGLFAPMKALLSEEERESGHRAAQRLGAAKGSSHICELADGSKREILLYKKNSPTPDKYPRLTAQIAKKPL